MTNILVDAVKATGPIYFKGALTPAGSTPVEFTALVLPFAKHALDKEPDTLMLAFEFSRPAVGGIASQNYAAL